MKQERKIYIVTDNEDKLMQSFTEDIKLMYALTTKKIANYDLLIVDTEDSFNSLRKLKVDGSVLSDKPIILMSRKWDGGPIKISESYSHLGLISVVKNNLGDYSKLNLEIKKVLNPNLPTKNSSFLFIVPVFNEEERIQYVLDFLDVLINIIRKTSLDASIRFIDDGSSDDSAELISQFILHIQKKMGTIPVDGFLEVHKLEKNTRKAGMYHGAIKSSSSKYYFFLDSDNSFYEEDILRAISIIQDGYYDVIQATKDLTAENRPFIRRCLSLFKRICTYFFLPKGVFDSQTGFKVINSTFAQHAIPYVKNEYGFAADLQLLNICKQLRFRALQLPIKCMDRDGSHVDPVKDTIHFLKSIVKISMNKEAYHEFK